MPPTASLPPGTSSSDWILQQPIVEARVETATGKVTGFAPDGLLAVAAVAKSMRAGNPVYAHGTRLRSLIKQLVAEVVNLKNGRVKGPIRPQDLAALDANVAAWFSAVAVPTQHIIPCVIIPDPAPTFSIGPIQFLHSSNFSPAAFGSSPATADVDFGMLSHFMQERAASWLAIVPVNGCEPERASELADLAVDIALAALQLIIPPAFGAHAARITGRTHPPYTASVVVRGGTPAPVITNREAGRGLGAANFDAMLKAGAPILASAGSRVSAFLTGSAQLPKLDRAWSDAAYWFHEGMAEPIEAIAIAKLETSIENLFGAGNLSLSKARLLQAIKGVFGLKGSDPISPGSAVNVEHFVDDIVESRSRILHGTWSTLGQELPLGKAEVATLAHMMLVSYTLHLDRYAETAARADKAQPFVDWMEKQATAPMPSAVTPSPARPAGR